MGKIFNKPEAKEIKEVRRAVYEEDLETGERSCSFEGGWNNLDVRRFMHHVPKLFRTFKLNLLKAEEMKNGKGEE